MLAEDSEEFSDRVVENTNRYVNQLTACVELVPDLLDAYADGGDYHTIANRIADLESGCDETNRELASVIATAGDDASPMTFTRIFLSTAEIIGLVQQLDEVANETEQFAEELVATAPDLPAECLAGLRTMAGQAAEAVTALRALFTEYIRGLCLRTETVTISDEIARIRELESESDAVRNEVIATAFDGGSTASSLICRELALTLDGVVDTIEDVTDRLCYINGSHDWIDAEPYPGTRE